MTTNVDVNTVLERHQERKQEGLQTENDLVPSFGLLTQTVISSPVIRWIFPARIRSSEHRDVAFIGVSRLSSSGFASFGTLELQLSSRLYSFVGER